MRKIKALVAILIALSTLLPVFSSCGECEQHTWDKGYVVEESTDLEEGFMAYTCTLCGATKTEKIPKLSHTVHDYSKVQWAGDNTHHWLVCDFATCNATTNKTFHTYNTSPKDGYICQVCKLSSKDHSFTDSYDYDGDFHWVKCNDEGCVAIAFKSLHSYEGTASCKDCGFSTGVSTK